MDWERIMTELLVALIPLFTIVLTAAIAYAAAYVRQRYIWAREARTVSAVEEAARDTVLALQQTVVDDLKAANEDGKLTGAEKDEIKRRALWTLQEKLTSNQRAILSAITADVTAWLSDKLERALVEHKIDMAAVSGGVPTNPLSD